MTRLYAQNASPKNRQKIRLNNLILLSLAALFVKTTFLNNHRNPTTSKAPKTS